MMDVAPVAADNLQPDPLYEGRQCPACGYDLRGAVSDRCSECGLIVDREALSISQIPWSRRREIGRVRAFLRTLGLVFIDSRRIRHELVRPQSWRDASWFRFVVALLLAIAFGIVLASVVFDGRVARLLASDQSLVAIAMGNLRPMPGYRQDLLVPWSAGVSSLWLLPVYPIALAVYISGVGSALHWRWGREDGQIRRVRAMGAYGVAGIVLLLPASLFYAVFIVLREAERSSDASALEVMRIIAVVLTILVAATGLISAVHRSGEWVTRATHSGAVRFFAAVAEMLLRIAVGVALCLGVLPWCLGFWRIAIASGF